MKTIYRYEYPTKFNNPGPYNARTSVRNDCCGDLALLDEYNDFSTKMNRSHMKSKKRPSIPSDVNCVWSNEIFSACESIQQLKKWFWGYNTTIKQLGFVLVEIKVKSTKPTKSKKQIGFVLRSVVSKTILK